MNINLLHLQQIVALAGQRSYAKAAPQLNISQPDLSRSIALLEDQLGTNLFDRSKRKVVPTVFGKHILQRGKPVLQLNNMTELPCAVIQCDYLKVLKKSPPVVMRSG